MDDGDHDGGQGIDRTMAATVDEGMATDAGGLMMDYGVTIGVFYERTVP